MNELIAYLETLDGIEIVDIDTENNELGFTHRRGRVAPTINMIELDGGTMHVNTPNGYRKVTDLADLGEIF